MKVEVPQLQFDQDAAVIAANRDLIKTARATCKAMLETLAGLDKANQALCLHPNKEARYDPNYAGGGFSHFACPLCGMGGG
jgi:hypothetical protein